MNRMKQNVSSPGDCIQSYLKDPNNRYRYTDCQIINQNDVHHVHRLVIHAWSGKLADKIMRNDMGVYKLHIHHDRDVTKAMVDFFYTGEYRVPEETRDHGAKFHRYMYQVARKYSIRYLPRIALTALCGELGDASTFRHSFESLVNLVTDISREDPDEAQQVMHDGFVRLGNRLSDVQILDDDKFQRCIQRHPQCFAELLKVIAEH